MTDHIHDWQPIPLECGKYRCACRALARRCRGEIVAYTKKGPRRSRGAATVRVPSRFGYIKLSPDERALDRSAPLPDPRYWRDPGEL